MSQIPAFSPLDAASARTTQNRFSELNTEDFVRIIFTELSNQDPFEPNDSSALLEQLNSIRSIESDLQLTDQLKSLVTENQLATAGNLIGRFVTGRTEALDRTSGFVVAVRREADDIVIRLDNGAEMSMNNVEEILDASPAAPSTGTGA